MLDRNHIPKQCRFCGVLEERKLTPPVEGMGYRCAAGRFDMPSGPRQWFAWSGIWRANKTVAAAQKDCPNFELHPQVIYISSKGRGV